MNAEKTKIINDIKDMFKGKDAVSIKVEETEAGDAVISISQEFINNVISSLMLTPDIIRKNRMRFTHTITLGDGTYTETDNLMRSDANLSGSAKVVSRGELYAKGLSAGFGKDNIKGNTGIVYNSWDTNKIKAPVKAYMETTGYVRVRPKWQLSGKKIAIAFAVGWAIVAVFTVILYLMVGPGHFSGSM